MFKRSLSRYRTALRHGILFNVPDGDAGGSGGTKPEKPISQIVAAMIARHGSAETALGVLAGENRDYRARHRRDQESLAAVKAPVEGSVVLTPEQAKDWEAYQKLGKPADVTATVAKVTEVEGKLKEREVQDLMTEVAGRVGYKPSVLSDRVKADNLHVEQRDVQVSDGKGGNKVEKLPYVRPADKADATPVLLTEYATKNWVDYLPSLKADAANGRQGAAGSTGITFPVTTNSSKADGANAGPLAARLEARAKQASVPNPLMPQSTADAAK